MKVSPLIFICCFIDLPSFAACLLFCCCHLQESQRASEETVRQLQAAQKERDSQIQTLLEVNKVAEKRKALLDELAIKYQKEYDTHREQSIATEEKHQAEVKGLQDEIATLEVGGLLFL